ncbi:MAG: RHS repeat-associated core domain-containing protein, partial [Thermodesulfobacteriota bacterium]
TVVASNNYLPYGSELDIPNDPFPDQLTNNTHQYTTKEIDNDIGLYYYGARYYSPSVGRFMSVDPVGGNIFDPQSFNAYPYVQNNPFKYIDPDGRALLATNAVDNRLRFNTKVQEVLSFLPNRVLNFFFPTDEDVVASEVANDFVLFPGGGLATSFIGKGVGRTSTSRIINASQRKFNEAGFVREFITETDQVFFRVFSGDNNVGGFLTRIRPRSGAFAQEALSLPRNNSAEFIQEVFVPKGTRLRRSRAASLRANDFFPNKRGGAEQFELLERLNSSNFGVGVPFN